jgi:hypothetical protein
VRLFADNFAIFGEPTIQHKHFGHVINVAILFSFPEAYAGLRLMRVEDVCAQQVRSEFVSGIEQMH